jgi:hypothetical protein
MKKNKVAKSLIAMLLGFICVQSAYSQQNFIPGYVVTLQGDTLKGSVDYRNWDRNPNKIVFRQEGKTTSIQFSPPDIKSFEANNEVYVSATVKTDISPRNLNNVYHEDGLTTKMDTVFLQVIISGTKSLYSYKSKIGIDNFYVKDKTIFELLQYNIFRSHVDSRIHFNKRYIGQLTLYFNNDPSIRKKLKRTEYTKTSLKNLFLTYYKQSSTTPKFQKKTDEASIEYGIVAGVTSTSVTFGGDYIPYLGNTGTHQTTSPSGGLYLDLILARSQGKWSVYNEIVYNSFHLSTSYYGFFGSFYYRDQIDAELGFSYLTMNNMARFRYPVKGCYLFINGGLSNGIIIDGTNHKTTVEHSVVTEGKALDSYKNHDLGYIGGIGVKYRHVSLEARYKKSSGFSPYVTLSSIIDQYYFLLGYRF